MRKEEAGGVHFDKPEDVDVATALQMIKVGIVPTDEIDPIGTIVKLNGDIPVRCLGERTREQFLEAIRKAGLEPVYFDACPKHYKFEAIEAVHQ